MILFSFVLSAVTVFGYPNQGPFPQSFDCPMRNLAVSFAQHIQPFLTQPQLKDIIDALNGSPENQNCSISLPPQPKIVREKYETSPSESTIYIDPTKGFDSLHSTQSGSKTYPFRSIQFGIHYFKRKYGSNSKHIQKKIYLRKGRYHITNTIQLSEEDSNLIIQNYRNEKAEISGAVPLPNLKWTPYQTSNNNYNIYQTTIPAAINISSIPGLRVNGRRGIQARYPNANPEIDGFGSHISALSWIPPLNTKPEPTILIHPKDYPIRNDTFTGVFRNYNLGIGGVACGRNAQNGDTNQFSPPAGFWCTDHSANGRSNSYDIPRGITINASILPNCSKYDNASLVANGAKISYWHGGHWASFYFEIASFNHKTNEIMFGKGGFQTAQSGAKGDNFYIENVLEELDFATEYFFEVNSRILYYFNNETGKPPMNLTFEATKLKVLFNLTGKSMSEPVENVTITGMVIRDTVYTYLDAHGMCSGGDSTYPRLAAMVLFNTKQIEISDNLFTRIDGNGILLNNYNEYVNIYKNEFAWLGRSGVILWGDTAGVEFETGDVRNPMGWDGTTLTQPRHINVSYNIAREFGIFVKEHSFYFQTKSCSNYIGYNIIYNAGRFGINFNDGFGGNNTIEKNLIFNTCRESGSGDTGTGGPFNSWDRQVYVTKVRSNGVVESTQKQYDYVRQNFFITNYFGMFAVNMDDGSSYFNITNNFLVYSKYGLKTSNGGHDGIAVNNIYAYVYQYCFWCNAFDNSDSQKPENIDTYVNNTCILNGEKDVNYGMWNCQRPTDEWPILKDNTVSTLNESAVSLMGLCNVNEKQFQSKYNSDMGTTINGPNQIDNAKLIQQARDLIF